ncbi:FAD-dependent oxidoreductase [Actinospica sp. MGRD01-02]|uniref:FAD-dependent oxidoreductase n=1 Tax=Actinospica acidithermotolerans TaxID=2828514 RepID=A0A941E5R2_9ACTN|nr:FAD-dependent oxidoreductase [Actinospica acidithermotolerans]MBR7825621.1 FAD-dependent oxidoreductase [Actinospica acidithermotolerans]
MKKRIVILGGGTGGTLVANRLRRALSPQDAEIVVVDLDDEHVYQPGLLFAPFGPFTVHTRRRLVHARHGALHPGIEFRKALIDHVDLDRNRVLLDNCVWLDYDVLVVATGARPVPERTEGLSADGAAERVHGFYTLRAAERLSRALREFAGGRLVVDVAAMPIKGPVAPLEFCFLADEYFRHRKLREKVELTFVTPLDGAFAKPVLSRTLEGLLRDKGIELVTGFAAGEVDGGGEGPGRLVARDGREVPFDLAVVVPQHAGAAYVQRSGDLGDELGFVRVDPETLRSLAKPDVFALGDATDVPTAKTASVAQSEGEVVAANVGAHLAGRELPARFDGHANFLVDAGSGPASPPGHLEKLAARRLYWHEMLAGRRTAGIDVGALPHTAPSGQDLRP